MSVLLFGVSHRSAPVSVLEQLSTDESDQVKIIDQVLQSPLVTEAMVLSTCNRVEVYAVVDAFHGGLSAIGQVLAEHSGMSMGDLTKYAYVRYSEAAVEHLFAVASGLDSAVIGEQQVLGQVRRAYANAEANRTVGRVLHDLAQRALSVGKRVHSETAIDAAGASVVSVALDIAGSRMNGLAGRTAAVVGAGSMGGLSVAHLVRAGVTHIHVVNRSLPRAQRLAEIIREQGVGAEALTLEELPTALAAADVVVSCTGAVRPVVSLADVHHALANARRDEAAQPLVLCDLGMPRDVDPAVAGLPGVSVVDMDRVQREPSARAAATDAEAARQIVAARSCCLPGRPADGRGHTDRHRPSSAGRRRRRGRAAAPGEPAAGPGRGPARRGRQDRAPRGRQAAARPHRAGQAAGQCARRRHLRRGAARTLRTRSAGRRRRGRR